MPKALALFSGGLDSLLAIKLLQEQGVPIEAAHLRLPFAGSATPAGLAKVRATAAQIGVPLHILVPDESLATMVAHPKYGYGKNFNPCQDCRVYQLRKAAEFMPSVGASFLVTGEVVGQRPMSQRREALFITDRESGLKGLILRPLSAKLLPPTIPEQRGWVDRGRLLDLAGRGRTYQEGLARQWGLSYPSPAGGCLLTYREAAHRYRNLLDLLGELPLADIPLVGVGRHFRLSEGAAAVIGRRAEENQALAHLFRRRPEGRFLLQVPAVPGPLALVLGDPSLEDLERAAALTARYSDLPSAGRTAVHMLAVRGGRRRRDSLTVAPATEAEAAMWRIV